MLINIKKWFGISSEEIETTAQSPLKIKSTKCFILMEKKGHPKRTNGQFQKFTR